MLFQLKGLYRPWMELFSFHAHRSIADGLSIWWSVHYQRANCSMARMLSPAMEVQVGNLCIATKLGSHLDSMTKPCKSQRA